MERTFAYLASGCLASMLLALQPAMAQDLQHGTYRLHNHPDGEAGPPAYGLRLDGLLDGDRSSVFTFDFDATQHGAAVFLDLDADGIRIHGTAWGGLDTGAGHEDPVLWTLDFSYSAAMSVLPADGLADIQVTEENGLNLGTITSSLGTWDLLGYAGSHGYVFQLGDEDGLGHRGFGGISGWGWLLHSVPGEQAGGYLAASDFLFTASPVPIPGALWLSASALIALGALRRSRPR